MPTPALRRTARTAESGEDSAVGSYAPCSFSTEQSPCSNTCNTAPLLNPAFSTGAAPLGTGGALVRGVYFMTGVTYFIPGDAGLDAATSTETIRETAVVSGGPATGTLDLIHSDNGQANLTTNSDFSSADASLSLSITCPSSFEFPVAYSATSTSFDLLLPQTGSVNGSYLEDEHFALQDAGAGD